MVDSVFAVAFVSVILVSGCPVSIDSGGGFAMGDGVQVNSFEFKPARLVGGQATLLQLELQNMGGLNVGDVHVNLYGLSNEWYDGGGSKMIGDIVSSNLQAFDTGGLRAPDPELKTAGQKRTAVWKFKSPVEPLEGTEFVHKAYARVCYPYRTVASATVEVMGEDEWLLQEQRGGVSQHPISVKQTAAPIQISIESMQPVISDGGLRMEMKISNVGGGSAFSGGDDCSGMFDDAGATKDEIIDLNRVDFGIEGFGDCEVYGAEEGEAAISLSRGKERTVVVKCEGFSSSMPRKEMAIDIAFDYYYYIDAETSVVVVGTGEEEEEEEEPIIPPSDEPSLVLPIPLKSNTLVLPVPPSSKTPIDIKQPQSDTCVVTIEPQSDSLVATLDFGAAGPTSISLRDLDTDSPVATIIEGGASKVLNMLPGGGEQKIVDVTSDTGTLMAKIGIESGKTEEIELQGKKFITTIQLDQSKLFVVRIKPD